MLSQIFNKRIVKSGIAYTVCNVILRGISFLTAPLFIRLLSPDEYGRYSVFLSFEGIIFIFSGLAIHSSIKNAKYDMKDSFDDYVKNTIYLDFFNSLLLMVVMNAIHYFDPVFLNLSGLEINMLVLSGFCSALISIYSVKLVMDYKSKDFILISFITVICGIGLSLLLIFTVFSGNHYYGRLLGSVGGLLIGAIYIVIKCFKNSFPPIKLSDWKYGLAISLPIVPHGLSQIALSASDRIMINYMHNAAQAGVYSFTYTISIIPQVLFSSVSNVWEPWFFENMNNGFHDKVKIISTKFCLLISVVFAMIACVVPEIIKVMATSEYYGAIDVSIIVLIGLYFATLYYIPCEIEYYFKKTKYIAVATLLAAIINVVLNYFGLLYFGYKIVAWTTLFTYFLYFLFHMYMACKIYGKCFFEIKKFFWIICSTCMFMLLLYTLIDFFVLRLLLLVLLLGGSSFWIFTELKMLKTDSQ